MTAFTHKIGPPLKAWLRARTGFPAAVGLFHPEWVGLKFDLEHLMKIDRVFDTPHSVNLHGKPGVIPYVDPHDREREVERYWPSRGWAFVRSEYLDRIDPAWVAEVRRCPEFRDIDRVPRDYPVDFGNGVRFAPCSVRDLADVPLHPRLPGVRSRATDVTLSRGRVVRVEAYPEEVEVALRVPRMAEVIRGDYDYEREFRLALLRGLRDRLLGVDQ